jgi:two-component system chemotaxis response regulator CheY
MKKFLIVDDDALCRALVNDILAPYGHCDYAFDGREAIDAVRFALEDREPYDLICLDIMMPGVCGHEALSEIRKLEAQHGIGGGDLTPVAMVTALSDSKHCIQAFREGCEQYVVKPLTSDKLLEAIRRLDPQILAEPVSHTA